MFAGFVCEIRERKSFSIGIKNRRHTMNDNGVVFPTHTLRTRWGWNIKTFFTFIEDLFLESRGKAWTKKKLNEKVGRVYTISYFCYCSFVFVCLLYQMLWGKWERRRSIRYDLKNIASHLGPKLSCSLCFSRRQSFSVENCINGLPRNCSQRKFSGLSLKALFGFSQARGKRNKSRCRRMILEILITLPKGAAATSQCY